MKSLKLLITLFVLSLLGCGVLGYGWWAETKAHRAEVERLQISHQADLENERAQAATQLAEQTQRHEQRLAAVTDDFESRLDALRGEQRKQLTAAYQEFESIFEGNKQTIEYIDLLEGKVKAGQAISKNEAEKLAVIAAGIGHLQKQYQKPMQEFQELADYFERQASRQPTAQAPKKTFGFFRRLVSRDYRESEKQYYREQGAQRAFEAAQGEFGRVYSSAQSAMRGVNLDAEAQIKKLYDLIEEKDNANAQDLTEFFDQARKALKTHQDVLQFEPQGDLPAVPAP